MRLDQASAGVGRAAASAGPSHLPLRLAAFYIGVFSVVGVLMPFWPAWLKGRGLDPAEIGIVLAAGVWAKVLMNPVVARLSDRRGETRRPLILLALASLACYASFALADGFWPILALNFLGGMLLSAMMPLADGLAISLAVVRRLEYGRIRLWGSLSFILASTASGWYLTGRASGAILALVLAGLGLTLCGCLAMPDWRRPALATGGVLSLLSDRRFLLFVATVSLIQSSHTLLYGFGTLHWQGASHAKETIGWLWSESVLAEVVVFALGARLLRRIGGARLLVLGGAAACLRWVATGLSTDLAVLAAVQLLHGLTFGAVHLAAMDFLGRATPPALSATAQSVYASVAFGIAPGLTMLCAGRLYESLAGHGFFVMAGLAIAGVAAAIVLSARWPARAAVMSSGGEGDVPSR